MRVLVVLTSHSELGNTSEKTGFWIDAQTAATKRFYLDYDLIDKVAHTVKLSEVNESDFDAVFYPGGNGP